MVDTRFPVSIQIMTTLAHRPDELVNSDELAKVIRTNPTFVRKLVAKLVEAGLVTSFRGKGGGIKLAKSPNEISLKDIYLASLEDKKLMCTPKKPAMKACVVSCAMGEILDEVVTGIENTTLAYLGKQHLSDLLSKVKKRA